MGKILVIGGGGFLGRNLIDGLVATGKDVRCMDLACPQDLDARVDFVEGSFDDPRALDAGLDGVDHVFHLASTTLPKTSNDDPVFDISTNLQGAITLLDKVVEHGIRKFIFISSGGTVYGVPERLPVDEGHPTNPLCSYGVVKLAVEKYLRLYGKLYDLSTCSLRLSNPYGRYQRTDTAQGAVAVFLERALNEETIEIWGDGGVVRDYVDVRDAVRAMLLCLEAECAGTEINIGSGVGTSLNQLVRHVEMACGHPVRKNHQTARAFDVPEIYLDITRAREILGWAPEINLQEGLAALASGMKTQERELQG
ncbi:MAG: NAD-dependent epimerase/dehydratase family protein [Planctomycetota bacterium]|jgi:UDP-glucose 4-epimerase